MNRQILLTVGGLVLIVGGLATMDTTWIRAQLGGTDSQLVLAHAYATGAGVDEDQSRATKWYLRAAEQGDSRAQVAVAARYAQGLGVEVDPSQATEWYRRAAEAGVGEARLALAMRHAKGEGAVQDNVQAAMWLILADNYVVDRPEAFALRDDLQAKLSETELTEARRIAADWRAEHGQAVTVQ